MCVFYRDKNVPIETWLVTVTERESCNLNDLGGVGVEPSALEVEHHEHILLLHPLPIASKFSQVLAQFFVTLRFTLFDLTTFAVFTSGTTAVVYSFNFVLVFLALSVFPFLNEIFSCFLEIFSCFLEIICVIFPIWLIAIFWASVTSLRTPMACVLFVRTLLWLLFILIWFIWILLETGGSLLIDEQARALMLRVIRGIVKVTVCQAKVCFLIFEAKVCGGRNLIRLELWADPVCVSEVPPQETPLPRGFYQKLSSSIFKSKTFMRSQPFVSQCFAFIN